MAPIGPTPPKPNFIPGIKPRNALEKYCADLKWPFAGKIYYSDDELNAMFLKQGHTEAELPRLRKKWDDDCDDYMKMMGGSPPIAGQKPDFGSSDFQVYRIPGSQYAIRIWDDEKERSDGQFLLDYFDVEKEVPVNTPRGYEIIPVETPIMLALGAGSLRSWEYADNGSSPDEIKNGEERFSVPEGSHWRLVRQGHLDLYFAVPSLADRRPAQFVTAVPFQSRFGPG